MKTLIFWEEFFVNRVFYVFFSWELLFFFESCKKMLDILNRLVYVGRVPEGEDKLRFFSGLIFEN